MPQMMPMNWFLPSITLMMTVLMMFINMNFLLNIKNPNLQMNSFKKINKNWSW
uniref:ATP synthase F0 subunit 8 n=1 Tax=Ammothea clausi TaxID=373258 RepID=UPI002264F425|nr:ATP synthase F0 subunit 8 [Ammothea clausi]UYX57739.1 ATP synthase F0 subunit 8 [Ammothea clausi]